jgi:acyl-CoA thioester hydrolase
MAKGETGQVRFFHGPCLPLIGGLMPAIYEHLLTVQPEELDILGHVNNLAYLRWMQDAAVAHSAAQGWPLERYLQVGAGWVVHTHQIVYQRPAFVGEPIVVLTWVTNVRKIRSLRKYKIKRSSDQTVLAVAQTDWAFIGFQHHVPRPIPSEVREAFEVVPDDLEPT